MPDKGQRQVLCVNPPAIAPPIGAEGIIGFDVTALGNAMLVSISGAPIVVNVNLDLADDEVAIGGPDSGGTRRLFQGRVDGANNIQEMVPVLTGAQALALGKVSATAFAGGDVGQMTLGVRLDAGGPLTADLSYHPLLMDAEGNLRVGGAGNLALGKAQASARAAGDVGVPAMTVRNDYPPGPQTGATDEYQQLQTDETGRLYTTQSADRVVGTAGPNAVAVAGASIALWGSSTALRYARVYNAGPGPLYLSETGAAAVVGRGLIPRGEYTVITPEMASAGGFGISNGIGTTAIITTGSI
jgi:hypothetical protein